MVFKTLRILAASGTVTPDGITWRASECLAIFAIVACVFRVQGSGFRAQGSGFRVQGPGFRVQVAGFGVEG